jgi:hypothetical protein
MERPSFLSGAVTHAKKRPGAPMIAPEQPDLFGEHCVGTLRIPTAAEIEAARTPRGAWTRKQLAQWGVPWPSARGWKRRLIAQSAERFATPTPYR